MSELKPCPNPWCDSHIASLPQTRVGLTEVPVVYGRIGFRMFCHDCGLRGPIRLTKAEASSAWNTRTKGQDSE